MQVLRFPPHGSVDACPAARVIVEEELLNRAGIELAVISKLQINRGFGIRLARRIQPVDVRFVFLDSGVSVVDWGKHEEVGRNEEGEKRQCGQVSGRVGSPLIPPAPQGPLGGFTQKGKTQNNDDAVEHHLLVSVVHDVVTHFMAHHRFDFGDRATLQQVIVKDNALGTEEPDDERANACGLPRSVLNVDVLCRDAVGARHAENGVADSAGTSRRPPG